MDGKRDIEGDVVGGEGIIVMEEGINVRIYIRESGSIVSESGGDGKHIKRLSYNNRVLWNNNH